MKQEEEPSNYNKPYYVKLRNILEELLKPYPNVLNLRYKSIFLITFTPAPAHPKPSCRLFFVNY
jgi:hypothetical protein